MVSFIRKSGKNNNHPTFDNSQSNTKPSRSQNAQQTVGVMFLNSFFIAFLYIFSRPKGIPDSKGVLF